MHLEAQGLVFDATTKPEAERVAAFVSLCRTRSGLLLCGFQLGPHKHAVTSTVRLCRSRDDGNTWQELSTRWERMVGGVPGSLSSGEIVEVEPGKLLLLATWFDGSDPERPFFNPVTEGILPSKQLIAVSTDEGDSWSPWRELSLPGLTGCSSTGPVLQWPEGTIGYPFESFKEFDDPQPGRHAAWMLISRDGGRTFAAPLQVAQHPEHKVYYWDQRLCIGPASGEYIALFWTHDLEHKKDLTVHLRRASISDHDADTTPLRATPIPGQIAAPLLLEDGRLLAFVVNRGRPGTLTLWQSPDGGLHWPKQDALVVYTHEERAALTQGADNIDFKEYWEDMVKWSFGHPAIRPLGKDRVLLAYYAGSPQCLSVRWARVNTRNTNQ
jgi:hypothetical protein